MQFPHGALSLILVDRFLSNEKATVGQLTVYTDPENAAFGCYTLEDEYRAEKVPGETRIPAGVYAMGFRKEGRLYAKYCARSDLAGIGHERGMLWIRNIPQFEYVYFHIGNRETETEGCPLLGTTYDRNLMTVYGSVKAYRRFYQHVAPLVEAGGCFAKFVDNDR